MPTNAPVAVDIRLLGSLEVGAANGADLGVPLGGPRQRTLLGLLALRAPHVVSASALIDGIWGEDPPPSAGKTLQAHVAYLRRTLAAAGLDGLIVTRPPGYSLAVDTAHIDAHRFVDLVQRGRAAIAAGALDPGADTLRTATQLWRGEVLADCPIAEWAQAEAVALQETRLYALEDLFAAELELGRHARVAVELETQVAREPLRERFWELLMSALWRSERQGDALAAYQRARTALVEMLGVEPGAALRRLETAILAGEPAAAGPIAAGPVVPGPATPAGLMPDEDPPGADLPAPLTSLVGRGAEVAEVVDLLDRHRLVTLIGVGGCGKTRLAIAIATAVTHRYPAGARFVDLTGVTNPELIPGAIATALGVPEVPDLSPLDLLTRHLRAHRCLLVVDNCEHVTDACAHAIGVLLAGCPNLRVLATSRQALAITGELAWPVPPLSVPAPMYAGDLAELRQYDGVALFVDRAAAPTVRALGDADAPALAAICRGLDGLPLALELAAARTAVLTVQEIAARIHDPALLRDSRTGPRPDHSALESAMAWSYQLLDPVARSRFRRLAVFVGGFTLDAVAAVWPEERVDGAIDALTELVAKSLVVMQPRRTGARYRLLETIRHYAYERLAEAPKELRRARADHARYYRTLAEHVDSNLHGPELELLLDQLTAEHENLLGALGWCSGHGSSRDELRFAAALARYCHLRGRYREGRRWLEDALSRSDGSPSPELARALLSAAYLALFECDYSAAARHGERALSAYRDLDETAPIARALSLLASVERERGSYDRSLARYEEAADLYRAAEVDAGLADTLQMAGFTAWLTGDLDQAERLIEDGQRRFHVLADPEGVASARVHLAAVAHYRGEGARARWLASDAHARFRELGFDEGIAWALNVLGLIEERDGQRDRATECLAASLAIHCRVGDRWRSAAVLEALAGVLAVNVPAAAAELLGAASAIRDAIGAPVPPQERQAVDAALAAVHSGLTDRELYSARARGEALRLGDLPGRLADLLPTRPRVQSGPADIGPLVALGNQARRP